MQIMGAPSEGGGLSGALASASGPLANLGMGLGQSIDSRNISHRKAYEDKLGRITESATDIEREKINQLGNMDYDFPTTDARDRSKK